MYMPVNPGWNRLDTANAKPLKGASGLSAVALLAPLATSKVANTGRSRVRSQEPGVFDFRGHAR